MGISPRWSAVDLCLVDVGAHDVVAQLREARSGGEPDVAGADHCDPAHNESSKPGAAADALMMARREST